MKRLIALLIFAAVPVAADTAPAQKIVANVNGDVITQEKLDYLYSRMNAQMRANYEKSGGKGAFLDNYLRKRLLIQEAIKAGFDKRPDVQADMEAARESALFERYVRDVIGQAVVTDADVRRYYDEHEKEFATPERIKARHIIVMFNGAGPKAKSKEEAQALIDKVAADLRQKAASLKSADAASASSVITNYFADKAKEISEDGSAPIGGDLGWMPKGTLDPKFEEAAYALKPGAVSDVVETRFGYHLILLEEKQGVGKEPFEKVKLQIRESLLANKMPAVMDAVSKLTSELRIASKVAVYPENIR